MFNPFRFMKAMLRRDRTHAKYTAPVQPKARVVITRILFIVVGGAVVVIVCGVTVAHIGAAPTVIEPPPQYVPGHTPPIGIHCGGDESAGESCYPPVDSHCYESGDAGWGCFTSATIQYNDQKIALLIDVAARTIALTSISAPGYSIGDLILAWGTPTGFNQSGRDIDVYWGARSTHLATCLFRPESRVDMITFYRNSAFAAPWHGFVRIKSKAC